MANKSHRLIDEPRKLPFQLLKEITNNFDADRSLGSGASGEVYKGVFEDGEVIAIKKLRSMIGIDGRQFKNEFEHLKRLRHRNIVQLVGFCDEAEDVCVLFEGKMVRAVEIHRALCLEFVPRGGLGKFLPEARVNWQVRFGIIKGICEGLKYLHQASVVHFDLKPDNILLDDEMTPKIADFGISRLLAKENAMTKSSLGTLGFLPPEFIDRQIISKEFDIFSLGVIIKRIVTGLMDYWSICDMDDKECIEHVHDNWRKMFQKLPANRSVEVDCKQVTTCIKIALDCMVKDRLKRPTMDDILFRLSKVESMEKGHQLPYFDNKFYRCMIDPILGMSQCFPYFSILRGNLGQSGVEGEDRRTKKNVLLRTRELPLGFLCEITNDFSEERMISASTSAAVFKGILHSGEEIAVKRLNGGKLGVVNKKFMKEDGDLLEIIEHENIVRLVGFCCEWKRKVVKKSQKFILTDELEYLLCYEYMPNGSLDKYIFGGSCQLDWNMRFKIIMRICEALHFLHTELHRHISHLALAPGNILLDKNMMPKLSDVGLSGLFEGAKTCRSLVPVYDRRDLLDERYPHGPEDETGYVAPEHEQEDISFFPDQYRGPEMAFAGGINAEDESFKKKQDISFQSNIYSLGVLIMQIATGNKFYNTAREWTDQYIASKYASLGASGIRQLKLCIQIGLACAELDRRKRPSIQEIVKKLNSKYGSTLNKDITSSSSSTTSLCRLMSGLQRDLSSYRIRSIQTAGEPAAGTVSPLSSLNVEPQRLRFHRDSKRLASCLLYLTNNTDERIAFRILTENPRRYHMKLPLWGIVPPKRTYTVTVTMRERSKQQPPTNSGEFLTLESIVARHEQDLVMNDDASVFVFFEEAKRTANHEVQEVRLAVVCGPREETASHKSIQSEEGPICQPVVSVDVHPTSQNDRQVLSLDVHPKEPWILTSNHGGTVCIWNYQKQELVKCFQVSPEKPVYAAKFIERKRWLVTGDGEGCIHVYSYDTMEEVNSFEAHDNDIMSLVVNPFFSFVLSASDDHLIKLWDWNKGSWECTRTFKGHHGRVTEVMFHPKDYVNFASASLDGTIKIWNMFSGKCNITLDERPDGVLCLHYFTDKQLRYFRQFLITGSSHGAAKVWDPETQTCVATLQGHTNHLAALCWLPKHEVLITGSLDGTIQIWKPTGTTYRLENIICLNLGAVNALEYIVESRRILVVACDEGIAIVEIFA